MAASRRQKAKLPAVEKNSSSVILPGYASHMVSRAKQARSAPIVLYGSLGYVRVPLLLHIHTYGHTDVPVPRLPKTRKEATRP